MLCSESERKQAFRIAYEFLSAHSDVMREPEDYMKAADDAVEIISAHMDNRLVGYLVIAVCEYIYERSEREKHDA